MSTLSTPSELWQRISQAGGVQAFIDGQLKERGFLVERRDTDAMTDREKERYKKELKQEAAERKKLNKETWTAYKTAHIVTLGHGIWWSDEPKQDKWDTPNSEERAAENELPALDSPKQLAEALGITIGELRAICFHRDAATSIHYARFTIPKRDGTERAIWAPMQKLKAAQRWVLHQIVERLPTHGAAHGFLAGRSILTNAAVHANSSIVLKMDVKDFFPTVTWRRVKGVFRRAGYREQMSTLLAMLCTEAPREIVELDGKKYFVSLGPRCLPQGAPTSPALTNALCLRLDRRLTGLANKHGWRYTRYADDLTFSLPTDAKNTAPDAIIKLATTIAEGEGFIMKAEKTRMARAGRRQTVTGLVVNRELPPRVPRQLRRQIRAALHNLKANKPLPEGESLARLQGYAAYINMTDPKLGKAFLDQLAAIPTGE
jgi:RNA-directed DNA polymerase